MNLAAKRAGYALGESEQDVKEKYEFLIKEHPDSEIWIEALKGPFSSGERWGEFSELVSENWVTLGGTLDLAVNTAIAVPETFGLIGDSPEQRSEKILRAERFVESHLKAKIPPKFIRNTGLHTRILVKAGVTDPNAQTAIISCVLKKNIGDSLLKVASGGEGQETLRLLNVASGLNVDLGGQVKEQEMANAMKERLDSFFKTIKLASKDANNIKAPAWFGQGDYLLKLRMELKNFKDYYKNMGESERQKAINSMRESFEEVAKLRQFHKTGMDDDSLPQSTRNYHRHNYEFYDSYLSNKKSFDDFIKGAENDENIVNQLEKRAGEKIDKPSCGDLEKRYYVAFRVLNGIFIEDYTPGQFIVRLDRSKDVSNPDVWKVTRFDKKSKFIEVIELDEMLEDDPGTRQSFRGPAFDKFMEQTTFYGEIK